jgi:hypothetical protein
MAARGSQLSAARQLQKTVQTHMQNKDKQSIFYYFYFYVAASIILAGTAALTGQGTEKAG